LRDRAGGRQGDADNQKRLASFQAAVTAGQKAAQAKNYADAVKSFTEALKLVPDDAKTALLLKQTQQAWNDAKIGEADALKQKVEQQNKAQLAALLKDADAKLALKQYAEAKGQYQSALKLYPMDAAALRGLQLATQALDDSKAKPPPPPPPKDNKTLYQKAMQDGSASEKTKKWPDAVKH